MAMKIHVLLTIGFPLSLIKPLQVGFYLTPTSMVCSPQPVWDDPPPSSEFPPRFGQSMRYEQCRGGLEQVTTFTKSARGWFIMAS